jgi:hypothetical protein
LERENPEEHPQGFMSCVFVNSDKKVGVHPHREHTLGNASEDSIFILHNPGYVPPVGWAFHKSMESATPPKTQFGRTTKRYASFVITIRMSGTLDSREGKDETLVASDVMMKRFLPSVH